MSAREAVSDGLLVVGASAVSFGGWLIYAPAGFIVAGLFVIALGALVGRRES